MHISNKQLSQAPLFLGIGIGVGIAVYFTLRTRRQRASLLARTRNQAKDLARQVADVSSSVAADILEKGREELDRQKKGILHAVDAGKKAYQQSVA
jgi:shikimate 5-dehydrogenase